MYSWGITKIQWRYWNMNWNANVIWTVPPNIVIFIFSIMSDKISWCIVNVRTIIVISDLSRNPIYFGKGQWQWETFRDKCSRLVERGSGELPEEDTIGTFLHISNGKSMIAVQNPLEMRLGRKLTECTQCLCNELCSVFFYARCA